MAWIISAGFAAPAAAYLGDFALIDHEGKFHQLSRYAHKRAIVLIGQRNNCTRVADQLPRFKLLRQKWAAQGVEFLMINANPSDSREAVRAEADVYGINFPILLDNNQLISQRLGLNMAADVVVVDPRRMAIVFKGPLDERRR